MPKKVKHFTGHCNDDRLFNVYNTTIVVRISIIKLSLKGFALTGYKDQSLYLPLV
jgi:hypothetical protein